MSSVARQIFTALQARQPEIETLIQSLVETESPSGDEQGSWAVVDLLVQSANRLNCVDEVERFDVPDFGQHLLVKAFQKLKRDVSTAI